MHHGTCVTNVPWCTPRSFTSCFLWNLWRGKRSRHSRRMRNPQLYVSGKRPILHDCDVPEGARRWHLHCLSFGKHADVMAWKHYSTLLTLRWGGIHRLRPQRTLIIHSYVVFCVVSLSLLVTPIYISSISGQFIMHNGYMAPLPCVSGHRYATGWPSVHWDTPGRSSEHSQGELERHWKKTSLKHQWEKLSHTHF